MSIHATPLIVAGALLVAAPAVAQPAEPPVSIRTEGLPTHVRIRLEAKAREGMTALIQYVNRTRMMGHQVHLAELLRPDDEVDAQRKRRTR